MMKRNRRNRRWWGREGEADEQEGKDEMEEEEGQRTSREEGGEFE